MTNDIGAVRQRQQLKAILALLFGFWKEQIKICVDKRVAGYLIARETNSLVDKVP